MSSNETPKKENTSLQLTFSPVNVPRSPASTPNKNLTGYPRIAKDIAANVYNAIQHWNDIHLKGCALVLRIAIVKGLNEPFPPELEPAANELANHARSLITIVDELNAYVNQLKALRSLVKSDDPLFLTWSVTKMVEVVTEIYEAYKQEQEVKLCIAENIAFSPRRALTVFYNATWTYQPYITNNIDKLVESFLTETGHR